MKDCELMEKAIAESIKSEEPLKCACLIAKDSSIVGLAHNTQRKDLNATAHAEITAIRLAGEELGKKNLEGCIAYCTCEPCTMCLSAMVYAKIEKLYYAISLNDVSDKHIKITTTDLIEKAPHKIIVIGNYMEKEAKKALGIS